MELLAVSDVESNSHFIAYAAVPLARGRHRAAISFSDGRVSLCVHPGEDVQEMRRIVEEKIAEIVCIGYKYAKLSEAVRPAGLTEEEREILLAALIAADLAEDKKYVLSRLRGAKEYSIDGLFTFRLRDLREKWKGVAACVPPVFTAGQLAAFMEFLLDGERGKIFLKGGEVYDSRCRRLSRAALIEHGGREMRTLREIVLSCASKVECLGFLPEREERFLRRYYAGRVGFH